MSMKRKSTYLNNWNSSRTKRNYFGSRNRGIDGYQTGLGISVIFIDILTKGGKRIGQPLLKIPEGVG